MKRNNGFTLIELMIVVAIIAIIAAVAIPMILNARMASNEASAISSLRTLSTANQTYETRFNSFAGSLADLENSGMIDSSLGSASAAPGKAGYTFGYTGTQSTFQVNANPLVPGTTGHRYFFIDTGGVIRFSEAAPAVSTDSPIDI